MLTKALALIGGLVAALAMGRAMAATPFGGDDTGFIPPTKDIAKCEDSVGKSLGKAAACILGCHKKRADGKLADETAEDNCENNLPAAADCKGKYHAVTGNSSKINALCPPCFDAAALRARADALDGIIVANNTMSRSAGTTACGGDDTGFIPPDKDTAKCEDAVGK